MDEFSRTKLLLGGEALEKLKKSKVVIFGVGGVGSYAAEGIARCGVGNIILVDNDLICGSNINRQLHALHSTVGQMKVDTMKSRILDINPEAKVEAYAEFFTEETEDLIPDDCDYIIDAIDTVSSKIELVIRAGKKNIPIISCMGAGNKLDPTRLEIADIYSTSVCPLCRVMRYELRKRNVESLKVVFSKEEPVKPKYDSDVPDEAFQGRKKAPGSISFVPSVAGLIIAGEVIKDICGYK